MPLSFNADIKNLFRPIDIDHMKQQNPPVLLDDYNYMKTPDNATNVFLHLTGELAQMPPDHAWPEADICKFAKWIAGGYER